VRAIVRDITNLAQDLRERYERIDRLRSPGKGRLSEAHQEELDQAKSEFERTQNSMLEYVNELEELGVELKDDLTGLVDFRSLLDGREVYLCWRLGEPEVGYWHELNAGVAGRNKLVADASRR
jgi:hypothetical protein